jgi:hypothetical protein
MFFLISQLGQKVFAEPEQAEDWQIDGASARKAKALPGGETAHNTSLRNPRQSVCRHK